MKKTSKKSKRTLRQTRSKPTPVSEDRASPAREKHLAERVRLSHTLEKPQSGHAHPEETVAVVQETLLPAIAAATGVGDATLLKTFIEDALSHSVPLENIEEAILQCYLFAGFPAALEGFVALREVCDTPAKGRIKAVKPTPELFIKRGEKLCRKIYGTKYSPLKRRSLELHPDLWNWMILEGYGKVLSRPPLTPATRELCIVACLVVTGWTRQLRSHIHGALNVGCTPESVVSAVRTAGYVAGPWPLQWGLGIAREEIEKASASQETASRKRRQTRRRSRD
jgi:4-carboxymuconolactone decarboxylase